MQKSTNSRSEFSSAVAQVAHERGLDPQVILDTIKQAIVAAFKKDHPDSFKADCVYDVNLDSNSGEAHVLEIAGDVSTDEAGVSTVTAKAGAKPTDVTPPGFGRIAAQTARQVVLQKIREAEKSAVVSEYEKRIGTLVSGTIIRFVGSDIIVDIGKAEAVLPPSEQVNSEDYRLNGKFTLYLQGIRDSVRGKEVVVSRVDNGLIRELFAREVPEVASKAVEIRAIARDPGSRTKIAVYSHQSGVDPVGSCVGQKGVRVQAVIGELNGEKIDIVQFSEDPEKLVAAALSPASNLTVAINADKQSAVVSAPADQLSLAIGRDGQNARLAGKLTGFHIDIEENKSAPAEKPAEESQPISNSENPTA